VQGARAAAARSAPAVANAAAGGWVRRHWQAPVAVAAGFVAVIGGLQLARGPAGGADGLGAHVARAGASTPVVLAARASAGATLPRAAAAPAGPSVARAQAEQIAPYVAAHRLSTMNAAFQMPGGGDIRNVSLEQPRP
jgi:hypothetical protein